MPRFERKLRIVLDWTVALFFHYDIVKLDLYCEQYPHGRGRPRTGQAPRKPGCHAGDGPDAFGRRTRHSPTGAARRAAGRRAARMSRSRVSSVPRAE
jgi:hypothetical protein